LDEHSSEILNTEVKTRGEIAVFWNNFVSLPMHISFTSHSLEDHLIILGLHWESTVW